MNYLACLLTVSALTISMLLVGCGGDAKESANSATDKTQKPLSPVESSSSISATSNANSSIGLSSSIPQSSVSSATTSSNSSLASESSGSICGWVRLNEGSKYLSFNSKTEAEAASAKIVLSGFGDFGCGSLAGTVQTHQHPPLIIVSEPFLTGLQTAPVIGDVKIEGDLLHVELTYSACQETKLDMVVSSYLRTSLPLQALYTFTGDPGNCGHLFTTNFTYDLRPLQLIYVGSAPSPTREILLRDLGSYLF